MFTPFNYQQLKSLSYADENALSDPDNDPDDIKGDHYVDDSLTLSDPDNNPDDIKGDHYVDDSLIRWMTEGTNPNMPPRSDCG